jgi:type IV pilus assembly protein PilY1
MLIMGGGYDTCEDGTFKGSDLNTCPTTGAKGNKVYVIDAADGTVLKTFNTDRSVVGDVTVVPNSITGLAEYAYAADTGGNVYRMNVASGAPSSWPEALKIASLGCATSTCPGGTANRKFLFGPEVVVGPNYNSVLLGSGDREHPLIGNTTTIGVKNDFFMLKDDRSASPTLITLDQTVTYNSTTVSALMKIDPNQASLTDAEQARMLSSTNRGWYMAFGDTVLYTAADESIDPTKVAGTVNLEKTHYAEQVVTSALTIYGTVTFSTHIPDQPSANSCGSGLGTARVYNVLYSNANPVGTDGRYGTIQGGGLPPSPTSGLVTIGDKTVPFVIGADPKSPLEGKIPKPPAGATPKTSRTYWYIQK